MMTRGMIIGAAQNDDDNNDDNKDDNDDEENDNWGGSQASTQAISHLGALTNTCPSCYDQLAVMNRMMMVMVLAMMMPTKGITVMAMMRVGDPEFRILGPNIMMGAKEERHTCFSEFILKAHFWDFESHLVDHHVSSHPAALKFRRGEEIHME